MRSKDLPRFNIGWMLKLLPVSYGGYELEKLPKGDTGEFVAHSPQPLLPAPSENFYELSALFLVPV